MVRPVRMMPRLVERVWGVRDLRPWFEHASLEKPIGEVWFTALDNPTGAGTTLGELLAGDREAWMGHPASPEVLLLKFIFTNERLSVQVHPDDGYAKLRENSLGKTEAWFILRGTPQAELGLGFKRTLALEEAREAAHTGAIEQLIDWRRITSGECWLVPAGTVHAIGAGLALVEIQENSDVTYRLFDYGRPRELHVERGFEVAKLGPYDADGRRRFLEQGREVLVECSHFTLERWSTLTDAQFSGPAPFYHLIICTDGSGKLDGQPFQPGSVFLVPAHCQNFGIRSERAEILIAYSAPSPSGHFARV